MASDQEEILSHALAATQKPATELTDEAVAYLNSGIILLASTAGDNSFHGYTSSELVTLFSKQMVAALMIGYDDVLPELITAAYIDPKNAIPAVFGTIDRMKVVNSALDTAGVQSPTAPLPDYNPEQLEELAWLESLVSNPRTTPSVAARAGAYAVRARIQRCTLMSCVSNLKDFSFDDAVASIRDRFLGKLYKSNNAVAYTSTPRISAADLNKMALPIQRIIAQSALPSLNYLVDCIDEIPAGAQPMSALVKLDQPPQPAQYYLAGMGYPTAVYGGNYPWYLKDSSRVSVLYWDPDKHDMGTPGNPEYIMYGTVSGDKIYPGYAPQMPSKVSAHNSFKAFKEATGFLKNNMVRYAPDLIELNKTLSYPPVPRLDSSKFGDWVHYARNLASSIVKFNLTVDTDGAVLASATQLCEAALALRYVCGIIQLANSAIMAMSRKYPTFGGKEVPDVELDAPQGTFPLGGVYVENILKGTQPNLIQHTRITWLDPTKETFELYQYNVGQATKVPLVIRMQINLGLNLLYNSSSVKKWLSNNSTLAPGTDSYRTYWAVVSGGRLLADTQKSQQVYDSVTAQLEKTPCESIVMISWGVRLFLVLMSFAGLLLVSLVAIDQVRNYYPEEVPIETSGGTPT